MSPSLFEMETSEDEERLPRGRPKTGNKKTPSGRPRGRPAGSRPRSSVLSPKEERQRSQRSRARPSTYSAEEEARRERGGEGGSEEEA